MFVILIVSVIVFIWTIVSIMRSEKSLMHILAEAKFEMSYSIAGSWFVVEDFMMRKKNRTELFLNTNKTVLITGGTRGIGIEVIKMFLKCDMNVIIGCRKIQAGEDVVAKLRKDGVHTGKTDVYELDVSSLESVAKFAKTVKEKYSKIHILLNCAGIMYVPLELTKDGYESQFATNYLGHFYLTHLLLKEIRAGGIDGANARIVNVTSCAHTQGEIDFEDINGTKGFYLSWKAYAQSKLAQVLFTYYLERLFKKEDAKVQVHCVHPGIVNTDLFDGTLMKTYIPWFIDLFFKTPEQGATPLVHTCISPYLEGKGGTYISNCRSMPTSAAAQSEELQDKFFKFTNDLLKIEEFGKPS